MLTLNRKPTTLAQTLSPDAWRNIAECAGKRARLITDIRSDRIGAEYASASVGWDQARLTRDLLPIIVCDGIRHYGTEPTINSLAIDRKWHLEQSLNCKPIQIPDYLSVAICDEDKGWQDKVCHYLQTINDRQAEFSWHDLTVTGEHDISGDIFAVVFYPDDSADYLWCQNALISVDGELYDISDSTVADCSILDSRIGWYVCDLQSGDYLAECENETQRYSVGYSNNPTGEILRDIVGDPVWHYGLNCFVGRLKYWPHPVRIYAETPCYGG
jgi:hypothetical protein